MFGSASLWMLQTINRTSFHPALPHLLEAAMDGRHEKIEPGYRIEPQASAARQRYGNRLITHSATHHSITSLIHALKE